MARRAASASGPSPPEAGLTDAMSGLGLRVDHRPLPSLIPFARNARTHSDAQVALIAGSIRSYGFTNPVLVDASNGIIAGHGRVLAARALGLGSVPVIELGHLSDRDKRALVIADNKLAERAGWDQNLLALEAGELAGLGVDLASLGFTAGDIDELMAGIDHREEATPDPPAVAVTRLGDRWCLGPHAVLCGDATEPAAVANLLAGIVPQLMVTDPPYGVNYDPAWRNAAGTARTARTGKVLNDHRADWREAWALFPGDVAYVWHGALHAVTVAESLVAAGFAIRSQIVWAKERLVLSRGDYHWQHEPCWYAVRDGGTGHWSGDRSQTTLWSIASRDQDAETVHGTQKPVECMRRPMLNNAARGQTVFDPFLGSGTSLIAAETTGRVCLGLELSPAYVDVIVERWQEFTGNPATLAGDGRSYQEIKADRQAGTVPGQPKTDGGGG